MSFPSACPFRLACCWHRLLYHCYTSSRHKQTSPVVGGRGAPGRPTPWRMAVRVAYTFSAVTHLRLSCPAWGCLVVCLYFLFCSLHRLLCGCCDWLPLFSRGQKASPTDDDWFVEMPRLPCRLRDGGESASAPGWLWDGSCTLCRLLSWPQLQ